VKKVVRLDGRAFGANDIIGVNEGWYRRIENL